MFPGRQAAVLYLEDQNKRLRAMCSQHEALLAELRTVLGEDCVVLK